MTDVTHDDAATHDSNDGSEVTVVASVEEVDAEVRAKLTGHSVAGIAEQAERAFATVHVRLTGERLAAYAEAVSTGSAFAIEAPSDASTSES